MAGQNRFIPGNCCGVCDLSARLLSIEGGDILPSGQHNYELAPGATLEFTDLTPANDWALLFFFGNENAQCTLRLLDPANEDEELATVTLTKDIDVEPIAEEHQSGLNPVTEAEYHAQLEGDTDAERHFWTIPPQVVARYRLDRTNRSLTLSSLFPTAAYPPHQPPTAELNRAVPLRLVFENTGSVDCRLDFEDFTRTSRVTPGDDCEVDGTINATCGPAVVDCPVLKTGRGVEVTARLTSDLYNAERDLNRARAYNPCQVVTQGFYGTLPFSQLFSQFGDPGGTYTTLNTNPVTGQYTITGPPTGNYIQPTIYDSLDPSIYCTVFTWLPTPLYWRDVDGSASLVSGPLSYVCLLNYNVQLATDGLYVQATIGVNAFQHWTSPTLGKWLPAVNRLAVDYTRELRWFDPITCLDDIGSLGTRTYRWHDAIYGADNLFDSPPEVGIDLDTTTGLDGPLGNFFNTISNIPSPSLGAVSGNQTDIGGGVIHQITGRNLAPSDYELEITFDNR